MRAARVAQWGLGLAAVLWATLLFAAPALMFPVGQFICHQRPERSFFVYGRQMPVCARCTGLYLGAALAVPFAMAAAVPLAGARARRVLAAAGLPTAITWTVEFAGLAHFSNIARCVAALPLGCAAAWLVLAVVAEHSRSTFHPGPR